MDFTNKNLWLLFEWNGEKFYVTQSLVAAWAVMAVLIVFAVIVRIRLRSFKSVPKGFQNVVEAMVETMSNFARDTMGQELEAYGGFYFTIFAFILLSNYSGLFGLRPPTADLATTAALALTTFVLTQFVGIRRLKGAYFKEFFSPNPIFFPINLIGEISKPVSLAFRLFGNLLSGVIIVGIVYEMLPIFLLFALPDIIHIYFDIFVGALQAFVFTMLSMNFMAQRALIQD
jgi:F-type H+-transporting ATPase subunit a